MSRRRIIFTGKGEVALIEEPVGELGPGQVRLKTTVSLMSTGTEGICLHRLFEPGSHWDQWVKYPFRTGYCTVGVVTEIAPSVNRFKVGDRVVSRVTHASEHEVDARQVFPLPVGIADEDASWFALGMIGFMGAKASHHWLGDSVAIIGAGPIGQMAVRWANASGAGTIVVIDTVPWRLDLASRGGATHTICKPANESKEDLQAACGGLLPKVVMDVTGHAAVLPIAVGLARDHGMVVLLGDTGTPSEQRLTPDVLRRGVRIVGTHVSHETPEWTEETILALFFNLLKRKLFNVDGLISHRFRPEQAVEAYDLATRKRAETMGILFDWR